MVRLLPLAYTADVMMMFVSLVNCLAHYCGHWTVTGHVSVMLAAHLSMHAWR